MACTKEWKRMPYRKPAWAVQQIVRASGLVEDICKHGVGHPNKDWLNQHDKKGKRGLAIHGCDGCCAKDNMRSMCGSCVHQDTCEGYGELIKCFYDRPGKRFKERNTVAKKDRKNYTIFGRGK